MNSNNKSSSTALKDTFLSAGVLMLILLSAMGCSSNRKLDEGQGRTPPPLPAHTAEIIVGRLTDGRCFVYPDTMTYLGWTASINPNQVYWRSLAAAGNPDGFTIRFPAGKWPFTGPQADISVRGNPGVSAVYTVQSGVVQTDYPYSITDDTTPCGTVPPYQGIGIHVTQ